MRAKPYLQLVRLPNVFTAGADSLAGWLIGGGALAAVAAWGPVVLASMCFYAAGIALNDVFDLELDRSERPARPLPSGAVSVRFAAWLAIGLFAAGLGLVASTRSLLAVEVAGALVLAIVAYDAGLRRTWLGPPVIGLCRGLNLLLGWSLTPVLGERGYLLLAIGYGLFVVGLTIVSRSETHTGRSRGVAAGLAVQDLALLGLALLGLAIRHVEALNARPGVPAPDRPLIPVEGLLLLGLVGLAVNRATGRAIVDPNPGTIQRAVKTSVLALVWIDVALVAAARDPLPALAVAAFWIPAHLAGRWLYST